MTRDPYVGQLIPVKAEIQMFANPILFDVVHIAD